jgi:plastocyanin
MVWGQKSPLTDTIKPLQMMDGANMNTMKHCATLWLRSCLTLFLCSAGVVNAAKIQIQVQDSQGKPVPDAVVYAEGSSPQILAKPQAGVEIQQKDRKFLPLVTVVQTGNQISFPNNDSVLHHIYSFSAAKKIEQKLYSGKAADPVLFDKAGLVILGCNIHDKMLAYVYVVDTPFLAKTDANGMAKLDVSPSGKYAVKVAHYRSVGGAVAEQALQLKTEAETLKFTLNLKPEPKPDNKPDDRPGLNYEIGR